jgi:hypothetical protein
MFLSDNHLHALTKVATKSVGLKGKAERIAGEAIKATVVVGATGAMAYVNGRFSEAGHDHFEVSGVPVDLAGGLALTALSFMDVFGRFDEIGHAAGAGMLGAYAARMGQLWGANAKVASAAGTPAKTAGFFSTGYSGDSGPPEQNPAVRSWFTGQGGRPTLYKTVDAHAQEAAPEDWAA